MKKRIITICLVAALLATCFAGTYAYLTDTKAVKNTFTAYAIQFNHLPNGESATAADAWALISK